MGQRKRDTSTTAILLTRNPVTCPTSSASSLQSASPNLSGEIPFPSLSLVPFHLLCNQRSATRHQVTRLPMQTCHEMRREARAKPSIRGTLRQTTLKPDSSHGIRFILPMASFPASPSERQALQDLPASVESLFSIFHA